MLAKASSVLRMRTNSRVGPTWCAAARVLVTSLICGIWLGSGSGGGDGVFAGPSTLLSPEHEDYLRAQIAYR